MASYQLVWQDEFAIDGVPDPERWHYDIGYGCWGNNESQYYTDRADNAFVKDGCLFIRAQKESFGGAQYTSTRLTTWQKASWQYGRFEIRAKLPKGAGSWPAIWMLPPSLHEGGDDWPDCGEIDIMEHVGKDENRVHVSLHSGLYNHMRNTQPTHTESLDDVTGSFHVYAMEWTPESIAFMIDGEEVARFFKGENGNDTTPAGWPFDQPFYLILNVTVGGDWGGPIDESYLPYLMAVDYVRVYQMK